MRSIFNHFKVVKNRQISLLKNYSTSRCSGISVISVGFSKGQGKSGTELGPKLLLDSGATKAFDHLIANKLEVGLQENDNRSKLELCSSISKLLSEAIYQECNKNRFCLTLGGDHSIATGSVSGLLKKYPDLCVIWIDAHADINTYESSDSKNVHGMPLSFLVDDQFLKNIIPKEYDWIAGNPHLNKNNLAYIGLRDVDEFEKDFIHKNNILSYGMNDIDRCGIQNVLQSILQKINPNNDKPIHVSFDVDALDPMLTPSTGTPVNGGLTIREVQFIAQTLKNTNNLVGLDVVEVNPLLGSKEDLKKTISSTITTMQSFILGRYT